MSAPSTSPGRSFPTNQINQNSVQPTDTLSMAQSDASPDSSFNSQQTPMSRALLHQEQLESQSSFHFENPTICRFHATYLRVSLHAGFRQPSLSTGLPRFCSRQFCDKLTPIRADTCPTWLIPPREQRLKSVRRCPSPAHFR
jgi:hypothetical protein